MITLIVNPKKKRLCKAVERWFEKRKEESGGD